ncbi:hypothetical protein [Algivirga pacifica]|uniref:Uncharacterized protein n=1 Tax=Algivirga pacifica TaxID=1162670 RepID=A0ABP9D4N8_9BACT
MKQALGVLEIANHIYPPTFKKHIMPLASYVEVVNKMQQLIQQQCTGSPTEFAKKLNISGGELFKRMQDAQAIWTTNIGYSKKKRSYYFL